MISKYKLKNISKINFALLPTPLEKLTRLSNKYKINLFMKRDDLTGHCFGGNKERKLEYIFSDAISKKAKTIITVGALQSNHCRMTSVFANKYNLKTELILIKNEKMSQNGGNYFLNKLAGANINIVNSDEVKDKINELISLHQKEGNNPYFIEGGGHNELGTIGYIFAIKELKDQLDKIKLTPNFIILPTYSSGVIV
jgi:D-cysteine desulfhydrase